VKLFTVSVNVAALSVGLQGLDRRRRERLLQFRKRLGATNGSVARSGALIIESSLAAFGL
jgi:hypothetical protein